MEAFNELMTAEKEALETIESAKKESSEAVVAAHTEQKTRIEETRTQLHESEQTDLDTYQKQIDEKVNKISLDVGAQVDEVKKRFEANKESLKSAIKKSFV